MRVSVDLDDDLARELERLAGAESPAALLTRALAHYLDQRGQLAHRRAVMEAILTGRPLRTESVDA
jgi:predicted transcriptional regulator